MTHMQKLSEANPNAKLPDAPSMAAAAVPVIGMAALWMSLFKQLLYPVLYAYYRTGDESAMAAQGAYSITLVIVLLALLLAHARLGELARKRRWIVAAFGLAGAAGIALRVFGQSTAAIFAGSVLSAIYLPVHFMFWTLYAWRNAACNAPRTFAVSFLLFFAMLGALELVGANSAWVSIICPIVSGAATIACPQLEAPELAPTTASTASAPTMMAPAPAPDLVPDLAPDLVPALDSNRDPASEPAPAPAPSHSPGLPDGFAEAFNLSEREAELAAYAHRNLSARRIAGELFIAESTVYTHLKRIYRKTDVHSKHELIELIDSWH